MVMTSDDGILNDIVSGSNNIGTQITNRYPSPGGQFEVFRDPAVEDNSFAGIKRVFVAGGISNAIEAIFIKNFFGEPVLLPITRHNVGASNSDFELIFVGHKLDLGTGYRQTDHSSFLNRPIDNRIVRCSLGRPPT